MVPPLVLPPGLTGFGPVRQIAWIVRDIPAAAETWSRCYGVGPFFHAPTSRQTEVRYRGRPATIDFGVALTYWGDLQVELIQPNDDAPSIYAEALASGQQGMHHVCLYADDIDQARARVLELGGTLIHEGRIPDGALFYADMTGQPGFPLIEFLQMPLWLGGIFTRLRETCATWDGRDPLRPMA